MSAHLHQWIDLIFVSNRRGRSAEQAHNIFHPVFMKEQLDLSTILNHYSDNQYSATLRSHSTLVPGHSHSLTIFDTLF